MTQKSPARGRRLFDPFDLVFGMFPAMTGYAAFVSWLNLIFRAAKGEDVREDWRVMTSTVAFITALTVTAGGRVRQTEALRSATAEMRELVLAGAEEAQRRNERADQRNKRDSLRQKRLFQLTVWLVVLAALTLAAAIVTLVVAIAK